jgi:phosphatidylglycerophosphatase A
MTGTGRIPATTSVSNRLAERLATVCGIGYLPVAPGTWASAVALPLAAGLVLLGGAWLLAFAALAAFLAGVWASGRFAALIDTKDPGAAVIDEVAGQWLALLPVALDWRYYPLAFLAFRIGDIGKIWPARNFERLPGGIGIMTDDVVAGVYAGLVCWGAASWFGAAPTLPGLFD